MVANCAVLVEKGQHEMMHKIFPQLHAPELGLGSCSVSNHLLKDTSRYPLLNFVGYLRLRELH